LKFHWSLAFGVWSFFTGLRKNCARGWASGEQELRRCRGGRIDFLGNSGGFIGFLLWHSTCNSLDEARRGAPRVPVPEQLKTKTEEQQENGMKRLNMWLAVGSLAGLLCVGTQANAQDRGGRGNFDPAQFRERMMEDLRDRLEVKDDTEWKALEPLIGKVMDARMATFRGGMGPGGMGRMGRRNGGNDNNNAGGGGGGGNGGGGRRNFFNQEPSPEAEALQRAIDGKASKEEMKAALAKYVEARKQKQADLEKAQADLRGVLTLRQEAIATMAGLL